MARVRSCLRWYTVLRNFTRCKSKLRLKQMANLRKRNELSLRWRRRLHRVFSRSATVATSQRHSYLTFTRTRRGQIWFTLMSQVSWTRVALTCVFWIASFWCISSRSQAQSVWSCRWPTIRSRNRVASLCVSTLTLSKGCVKIISTRCLIAFCLWWPRRIQRTTRLI